MHFLCTFHNPQTLQLVQACPAAREQTHFEAFHTGLARFALASVWPARAWPCALLHSCPGAVENEETSTPTFVKPALPAWPRHRDHQQGASWAAQGARVLVVLMLQRQGSRRGPFWQACREQGIGESAVLVDFLKISRPDWRRRRILVDGHHGQVH